MKINPISEQLRDNFRGTEHGNENSWYDSCRSKARLGPIYKSVLLLVSNTIQL